MNDSIVQLVVDIKQCQRCEEDHDDLVFKLLSNPVDDWNSWSICPKTQQPVLLRVVVKKD